MKPLTKDELELLDEAAAKGETIRLWLVWDTDAEISVVERITSLRLVPGRLLYINDDPIPLSQFNLEALDFPIFDNYWHAYAYKLKLEDK